MSERGRAEGVASGRVSVDVENPGVVILGAGQHGRVVASVLDAAAVPIAGHYDDDPDTWGTDIGSTKVLGSLDDVPSGAAAVIGIGDNRLRRQIAERLDLRWAVVIHPFSWVDPRALIGQGTVVCAGVTVQTGAAIGAHVILNNGASVGHDARVSDYAHLTVAHLGGESDVGEGAFLGIGSVVLPRLKVGAWATVGAGAVVTTDARSGVTLVGNPARELTATTQARPPRSA